MNPNAVEVLDNKDNDCDGEVDEGLASATYYLDDDGDGFGDAASFVLAQSPPMGYVTNSADCDDTDPGVNPNAVEVLDNKDNDCDGEVDEGLASATYYRDNDGDGFGEAANFVLAQSPPMGYVTYSADCDDTDPGIPGEEILDNIDNDCDG